jgi:hypothetical protein
MCTAIQARVLTIFDMIIVSLEVLKVNVIDFIDFRRVSKQISAKPGHKSFAKILKYWT